MFIKSFVWQLLYQLSLSDRIACQDYRTDILFPVCQFCMVITMSTLARQTKTDTCANSVDPDETTRNEPSHQALHCLPFCFFFFFYFRLNPIFVSVDMSKFKDESVHLRNSGMKWLNRL